MKYIEDCAAMDYAETTDQLLGMFLPIDKGSSLRDQLYVICLSTYFRNNFGEKVTYCAIGRTTYAVISSWLYTLYVDVNHLIILFSIDSKLNITIVNAVDNDLRLLSCKIQ